MDAEDLLKESEGAYDGEHDRPGTSHEGVAGKGGDKDVKDEMTSLDIRFLVRELNKRLAGGIFRKIYQYGGSESKQMIFGFFMPRKDAQAKPAPSPPREELLLYTDKCKMFLTRKKEPAPQEPSSFCMFLRKHLMGRRVMDIRQHGFDRVVEFRTDGGILIFELFSKGNVILCDSSYKIIMPMEIQRWRHRVVIPKETYRFPPMQSDPFSMDPGSLRKSMESSGKNVIATLATSLSLGPLYAKEVCSRAGVDGAKEAARVTQQEASGMLMALLEMDKSKDGACVYAHAVAPFPLAGLGGAVKKESFSDALDEFFSHQMLEVRKEEKVMQTSKEIKRIEKKAEKQAESSEKWKRIEADCTESAESINRFYPVVEAVINGIRRAKEAGMEWTEIKQKVQGESSPEAEAIKEIREGDGIVVLDLGGKPVEIEFTKSAEENAARYYEEAKWARSKFKGAEAALENTGKQLAETTQPVHAPVQLPGKPEPKDEISEDEIPVEEQPKKGAKKVKKRWFEYYRWFISSEGFLVIAGKNATQNENIIKKRMEPTDLVFHSDIHGAAFVIIKSEGKTITQATMREASEFAAAHSKAWAKGLGRVDVYAMKPEQISKTPDSGQSLAKGAFVVRGEKAWFKDVPVKLCIGVWINRQEGWAKVVAGPLMPVRRLAKYFVTLKPGFSRPPELAASIKRSLLMKCTPDDRYFIETMPLEELQGQIPSGMSDIIEGVKDFDYS